MKTRILSVITLIVAVFGVTNLTYAAPVSTNYVTTLTNISAINKIEIHGNVVLYISDASTDQVKVYNKYYAESALVQSKNGVLRIASYTPEKLVVWVSANDLRTISAFDNAEVKSFGELSKIEFNVDLHDNATAKLNLTAYSTNISVNDFAKIDLSGNTNDFNLSHDFAASINNNNFSAVNFTDKKINFPVELDTDMAGI